MRHRMRTMRTILEQNPPHLPIPLPPRILSMTLHIPPRHQLVRLGKHVQPRNLRPKHLRIVQTLPRPREHRLEPTDENREVEKAEREVDEQRSEDPRGEGFGQGVAHGLVGAGVGCFAGAAVEDYGAESFGAVGGGEAGGELDGGLGAAVGEDVQQDLRVLLAFWCCGEVGCEDVSGQAYAVLLGFVGAVDDICD